MSEANIQKEILLRISRGLSRLFRVNVGRAWTGRAMIRITQKNRNSITLNTGDIVIREGRPFKTGVPAGFSDTIGWTSKIVTDEMVGEKIAIFTAIEVKRERGKATAEQQNFIDQVNSAGGLAGVARSADEAEEITNGVS